MLHQMLERAMFPWRAARSLQRGLYPRQCPLCLFEGRFLPYGSPPRADAMCPKCRSVERHRLFKLWLNNTPNAVRGSLLHFAPERAITALLTPLVSRYVSADLRQGRADLVLDIEKTGLPSASFDCVLCSHVLEHVNDKAALAEMWRILAPNGIAILMVPIIEGWQGTFEDATISTPTDRQRFYGQADHVRYYGADFRSRVLSAGFSLSEFTAEEPDASRYSLSRGEKVFVAKKVAIPQA